MHDQIMALVRQQFTAAEIAAQIGCTRADVYAAINGPEIEFVELTAIDSGSKLAFCRFLNGEWHHFMRDEDGVKRLAEAQGRAA